MQLFNPDSSVKPFLRSLSSINELPSRSGNHFVFYSFGDTLKECSPNKLTFKDNCSNFPQVTIINSIDKSQSMIIISDANWTNSVSLQNFAENKALYYLKLPKPKTVETFNIEIKKSEHPINETKKIECILTGITTDTIALILKCKISGIIPPQKTIQLKPGPFHTIADFEIPTLDPGIYVMRFEALVKDSIVAECRHLQQIHKNKFFYRTLLSSPSIDNRFLNLAFSQNSSFSPAITDTPDVMIITAYTQDLSSKLNRIPGNKLLFFAGTLPCTVKKQSTTNTLITDFSQYSEFNRTELSSLPPVSVIYNCNKTPVSRIYAWVSCQNGDQIDTVPALYMSNFVNKKALHLSLTNFWKWDFFPLVSDLGEENAFSFSRRVVDVVKEILISTSYNSYVSMIGNEITSSDSFEILHYMPQNFTYNEQVKIHCVVKNKTGTYIDSSIVTSVNGSGIVHTSFHSLPEGIYEYQTSIYHGEEKFTFTDSVFVPADNREDLVSSQNEFIFSDIARPIDYKDSLSLIKAFKEPSAVPMVPIKSSITFNRNWILISLILIIYGTELFLRRRMKLD
jgi:hypothetical protein